MVVLRQKAMRLVKESAPPLTVPLAGASPLPFSFFSFLSSFTSTSTSFFSFSSWKQCHRYHFAHLSPPIAILADHQSPHLKKSSLFRLLVLYNIKNPSFGAVWSSCGGCCWWRSGFPPTAAPLRQLCRRFVCPSTNVWSEQCSDIHFINSQMCHVDLLTRLITTIKKMTLNGHLN